MIDEKTNNALTSGTQKTLAVKCPCCGVPLKVACKDAFLKCPECQNVLKVSRKTKYVKPSEDSAKPSKKFLDRIQFEKWKAWV